VATVRQRQAGGQGNKRQFFNVDKDLAALSVVSLEIDFPVRKEWDSDRIASELSGGASLKEEVQSPPVRRIQCGTLSGP
jgi:hypothetical protein